MTAVVTEFRTRVVTDPRNPVLTLVEASWEDTDGILQTVTAQMEDRSIGGARIRVKTPIAVGTRIRVRWRHDQFSGTARYCRAEEREYLVGIQRDASENPIRSPDRPSDAPTRKSARTSDPPVSTGRVSALRTQSAPKRLETRPEIIPPKYATTIEQKTQSVPHVRMTASARTTLADSVIVDGIQSEVSSPFKRRSVNAIFRAELNFEFETTQPAEQAGKERKSMRSKWLGLLGGNAPQGLAVSNTENGEDVSKKNSSDENSSRKRQKENFMSDLSPFTQKTPVRSAREVSNFEVELLPMEDIYRAAGIMNPRRGYTIGKVVEMLRSEHMRGLSKEMKRAAILMALDTSDTPVEQIQKDAKARHDALDAHEALQKKHVEAEWARKAEEAIKIQAELDSIKAHYLARIDRNMEVVAQEKATFASWLTLKQQECQSMSEAVELCLKTAPSEPASVPSSEVSVVKVSAKTAGV